MTPNKIPGMILKGIGRKKNISPHLRKRDASYSKAEAKAKKESRELEQAAKNKLRGL
jgi:hypothetical protein